MKNIRFLLIPLVLLAFVASSGCGAAYDFAQGLDLVPSPKELGRMAREEGKKLLKSAKQQPNSKNRSYSWTRSEVIKTQEILVSQGYDIGKSGPKRNGVDGSLGGKTSTALRDYQEKNNLPASGYLNPQTKKFLGI